MRYWTVVSVFLSKNHLDGRAINARSTGVRIIGRLLDIRMMQAKRALWKMTWTGEGGTKLKCQETSETVRF